MATIKRLLKNALPQPLARLIARHRRRSKFAGMSSRDIFDRIYADGFWGRDDEGNPISGTGSHDEEIVGPYVAAVRSLLGSLPNPSVVDLGCGDFNIGQQLLDLAPSYVACDISGTIIELNRQRFAGRNVTFRTLDLAEDELPPADVCLVRQVLQHLSNHDVGKFVARINATKPYRYLVVSEHVAANDGFRPNLDKPTGPGVRVEMRSGIDLAYAPFELQFASSKVLLRVRQDMQDIPAYIVTTAYELAGQ